MLELCLSPPVLMWSPPRCADGLLSLGSSLPVGDPEGQTCPVPAAPPVPALRGGCVAAAIVPGQLDPK